MLVVSRQGPEANELVIWDVGLGAGSNAMAAIHCFEKCFVERGKETLRPLRLISFEVDLDPLILAARYPGCFPHLRHGAPSHILESGKWKHTSNLLQWELLQGDFADFIESAKIPEVIFYDPFSYKTDCALWAPEIFSRVLKRCLPRSAELYTYSASTAVRVALLAAGFFVAQGIGTGPKSETTIAFTSETGAKDHPLSPRLLGHSWLTRWRRSDAKFPATLEDKERPIFEKLIETHQQFSGVL